MGHKLQKEAARLGLTDQPKYTFFMRPRKMKMKFSKYKPDVVYIIEQFIMGLDPETRNGESGGGRNNTFYYLSPKINFYAEIADKMAAMVIHNPDNHVLKIDLYTNNQDYVKAIVQSINSIWEDGIVNHLNLKKLANKYKVNPDDIVKAWQAFL